jgi:GGDEF domain-containing protein
MLLALISTNAVLIALVVFQRLQIKKLYLCPSYGCLTRQGVDAQWQKHKNKSNQSLIFLDLDNIHRCNEEWGYAVVDAKIKASLKCRKNELLGRWYSGDELIIIVPTEEAVATYSRIQKQLEDNGLSAKERGCSAALNLDKDGQPCLEISRLLSWILVDGCPSLSTENPPYSQKHQTYFRSCSYSSALVQSAKRSNNRKTVVKTRF